MKYVVLLSALAMCIVVPVFAVQAEPPATRGELDALTKIAFAGIAANKDARGGLTMACVSLSDFKLKGKWAGGELREKHSKKCGGDPAFAPRITSVWVDRVSHKVFVENLEGQRVAIEKFHPEY